VNLCSRNSLYSLNYHVGAMLVFHALQNNTRHNVFPVIRFNIIWLLADLWPWESLQQCPLTWWIFRPSLIQIHPLHEEILRHAEW